MRRQSARARQQDGFTLVELLVALMVMALLAVMGWRGLDGMVRATAQTQQRSDALMALQTGLSQWGADLDAMVQPPRTGPAQAGANALDALDWNGQTLRITRTDPGAPGAGLRVVAWSRRDVQGTQQWLRWQSASVGNPADWQAAWMQAAIWAQNPGDAERQREVAIVPLSGWQVFYFRNDAWSNPLSSAESAAGPPDALRLVLTLPPRNALTGTLTRDWIRPTVAGNKS